jgi:hypothetical protein
MPDPDEVEEQDEELEDDETPEEESLEGLEETPEQEAEGEEPAEDNVAVVEEPTKSEKEALQWQEEIKQVNERLLHLESENESLRGQLKKRKAKPKPEPEEPPQNTKKPYRRKRSIFPRSQVTR